MNKGFGRREIGAGPRECKQVLKKTCFLSLASSRMHILLSILLLSIYLSIYLIMGYKLCGLRRKRVVNMYGDLVGRLANSNPARRS
jgi:hypothetical protein